MARYSIGITALVIGLVVAQVAPLGHTASGQATLSSGLGGFEAWLNLARQHEPGRIDAALKQEREIPLERHFALIVDLEALLEFVRNPDLEYLRKARRADRGYSLTEQAFLWCG